MVSLYGFYRASIDVFGIFSIYGAMMLSIISIIYLFSSIPLILIGITPITLAGFFGIVYLVINLPHYSKLLDNTYDPSDKEKFVAIILMTIFLILLLISILPYL